MSVKLMAEVWTLDLALPDQSVLLVLADHANDDGICWPSIPLITWKLGCDRRTTQRSMASLKERKIIEPIRNTQGGRGLSTVYRLDLTKGGRKSPFQNEEKGRHLEQKGGKSDTKGRHLEQKGGAAMPPEPSLEPPYKEPSLEPPLSSAPAAEISGSETSAKATFALTLARLYRDYYPNAKPPGPGVVKTFRGMASDLGLPLAREPEIMEYCFQRAALALGPPRYALGVMKSLATEGWPDLARRNDGNNRGFGQGSGNRPGSPVGAGPASFAPRGGGKGRTAQAPRITREQAAELNAGL